MPSILVAGASKGIGRGVAEHYAAQGYEVFATMRKPDNSLDHLGSKVKVLQMDVTDEESVAAAAKQVDAIDIMFVNAGIGGMHSMVDCPTSQFESFLQTNLVGAHRVVHHFIGALKKGTQKKIITMTSIAGSIETMTKYPVHVGSYSVAKAALCMLCVQYHNELKQESKNYKVIAIHPGHVDTDMTREPHTLSKIGPPKLTVKESVEAMSKLIDNLTFEQSAKAYQWDGQVQPW